MTRANLKGEAVINGVFPQQGMWLVHLERRRCYGRILRVDRHGCVWVERFSRHAAAHDGSKLYDGGYSYADELPTGDGWRYFVDL